MEKELKGTVAVIGPGNRVLPFASAGALVHETDNPAVAAGAVKEFASRGCLFIFVEDQLLERMEGLMDKYSRQPFPCITGLPGGDGYSRKRLNSIVKKSIGIDIEGIDR